MCSECFKFVMTFSPSWFSVVLFCLNLSLESSYSCSEYQCLYVLIAAAGYEGILGVADEFGQLHLLDTNRPLSAALFESLLSFSSTCFCSFAIDICSL